MLIREQRSTEIANMAVMNKKMLHILYTLFKYNINNTLNNPEQLEQNVAGN